MHIHGHILQTLLTGSIFSFFLVGCGSDRVNIEFKTSPDIYVDDSKTDPDKLNKELEYDLREAEKKRRQKEREAADKAKEETEKKAKMEQKTQEQMPEKEKAQSNEDDQPIPQ
ncbi:MAG: hypothetical protein QY310_01120 [Candidatus Jettenia sp. CY-1]|nr:MAG: hypothetical protein QY310_01120 [Candidatus Jettenia sp. CY-1]